MHRSLIILGLLSALMQYRYCRSTMKLTNAVCESYNKSWITFEQCRLKAISRNLTILNLNGTFLYPAKTLRMTFEIQKKASGYKPWLVKHSFDFCSNLVKASHPVAKVLMEAIKKKTNVNHPCPYVGSFYSKNLHISPADVKLPLPTGEYVMLLTFSLSPKPTFIVNIYFEYFEDIVKQ